jgi:hypothetical protein
MRRRCFVPGLALLLAGRSLLGDITLPANPGPQADSAVAVVRRGESTTILLRAHYGGAGGLFFQIIKPPAHGKVLDLRVLSDRRAEIVYESNRAEDFASDRFSYAVRVGDRLSSPAEVRISIEEPPPALHAPAEIDFGEVMAGDSATRSLTLANTGGGVLEGRISVSDPWEIAVSEYRLGAGASEDLLITFRPEEGRSIVGLARLTGPDGAETSVRLTGIATSPVTIEPIRLRIDPPAARAMFRLANKTSRSLPLQFATSSRIQPLDAITLAPRETKEIDVLARTVGIALQDEITILGRGFRVVLPVEIGAAPAKAIAVAPSPAAPVSTMDATKSTPVPFPRATPVAALTTPTPSPVQGLVAVRARRLSPEVWELSWRQPEEPVASYVVEERILSLDGAGKLETSWRTVRSSVARTTGKSVTARVESVDPKQLHMVRVRALGPDRSLRWETPLVSLAPVPERAHGKTITLLLLTAVLALFLVLRWRGGGGRA